MRRRRRAKNLTERLRPSHQRDEPPEPMVSTDEIRMFLYRWMIETGDPVAVIAKGFDLDVELVSEIVEGSRRRLSRADIGLLEQRLGEPVVLSGQTRGVEGSSNKGCSDVRPPFEPLHGSVRIDVPLDGDQLT